MENCRVEHREFIEMIEMSIENALENDRVSLENGMQMTDLGTEKGLKKTELSIEADRRERRACVELGADPEGRARGLSWQAQRGSKAPRGKKLFFNRHPIF